MIFGEQSIILVLVASIAEGNGSSIDNSLNTKTAQHSPAIHLPGQVVA